MNRTGNIMAYPALRNHPPDQVLWREAGSALDPVRGLIRPGTPPCPPTFCGEGTFRPALAESVPPSEDSPTFMTLSLI
jgi:hypothetical protein